MDDRRSGYHLYVIRVTDRDRVFARLREAGIGVNVHYMPIPAQPYYRDLGHDPANYPGAQAYYRQAISLPCSPASPGRAGSGRSDPGVGAMRLALGTVQFGLDYGISNRAGEVQDQELDAILALARQLGVDTLDTAQA